MRRNVIPSILYVEKETWEKLTQNPLNQSKLHYPCSVRKQITREAGLPATTMYV